MTPQEQRPGTSTETNIKRIMRLAEERKAQGISIKQPVSSPAPAVTEAQPSKAEPEAKIKTTVIPGTETPDSRNVWLEINGKDSGMAWGQQVVNGKPLAGEFQLKYIDVDTKGSLSIPSGTSLSIEANPASHGWQAFIIRISGGNNAKLPAADLKELIDVYKVSIRLTTRDSGAWKLLYGALERENGKANFRNPLRAQTIEEVIHDLSIGGAIVLFKEWVPRAIKTEEQKHPFSGATLENASGQKQAVPQTPEEKIRAAEETFNAAAGAYLEADSIYRSELNENESYKAALKVWYAAHMVFYAARETSGLETADFQATPQGKNLWNEQERLWKAIREAEKVFQATPSGKALKEKHDGLWAIRQAANEALKQAKAANPSAS